MNKVMSNKAVIVTLIAPGLLTFLFAVLAPIILSIYYGFTNFSGIGSFQFIGLQNYVALAKDEVFWLALFNSCLLGLGFVCIQHPLAIITAAVLDRLQKRAEGFFRCVYFIPNVISVAVIAALWRYVYNANYGMLNNIIKMFGGEGTTNWLGSGYAIWSVLIVLIWHGFGWGMLIYYTGIKNIDPSLYEAAEIDGCDSKRMFMHVTLPLMRPVIQVNVTLAIISALKQMETVYQLTNGGPGNETQFLATYLYQQAFSSFKYGYGNAIGVIFILICLLANMLLNRAFREKSA